MRTLLKKPRYIYLLVLSLILGLSASWAQEDAKDKSKAKTPTAAKAKGSAKSKKKEPMTGTWTGTYGREGVKNTASLDLVQKGTAVSGSISVEGATLQIEKGVYDPKQKKLSFEVSPSADERYQVTGTLNGDTLDGQWKRGDQQGPFRATRDAQ